MIFVGQNDDPTISTSQQEVKFKQAEGQILTVEISVLPLKTMILCSI